MIRYAGIGGGIIFVPTPTKKEKKNKTKQMNYVNCKKENIAANLKLNYRSCCSYNECTRCKGEVVTSIESMPQCT